MSDSHPRSDRSACAWCLRSITMPKRDRKGQTRREAGAQSSRTSEGGGRVTEPPRRAKPATRPSRVGAQRRLEECPRGHTVAAWDGSKHGPGEARTPPGGGAGHAGAPGAPKGPFGKGEDESGGARDADGVDPTGPVVARTQRVGCHSRTTLPLRRVTAGSTQGPLDGPHEGFRGPRPG